MTTLLPGNRYIINNRDSEKRIKSIDINLNVVNTTVVSNMTYRPDGQVKTLTFNNGETLNNTYDAGGNLTSISRSHGNTTEAFNRDWDGQLTSMVLLNRYTRSFQYDALDRLTNMTGGYYFMASVMTIMETV